MALSSETEKGADALQKCLPVSKPSLPESLQDADYASAIFRIHPRLFREWPRRERFAEFTRAACGAC